MPRIIYSTEEERKAAAKASRQKYYKNNKEYFARQSKEWRKNNPDKVREINKKYDQKNKERRREWEREYRSKNPLVSTLKNAKIRAKEKGIEFDLKLSDVTMPEYCPVLGIKLDRSDRDSRPELDRKDNSKGYVKGNVFVISGRANRIKSDASLEELLALVKYCQS